MIFSFSLLTGHSLSGGTHLLHSSSRYNSPPKYRLYLEKISGLNLQYQKRTFKFKMQITEFLNSTYMWTYMYLFHLMDHFLAIDVFYILQYLQFKEMMRILNDIIDGTCTVKPVQSFTCTICFPVLSNVFFHQLQSVKHFLGKKKSGNQEFLFSKIRRLSGIFQH